MIFFLVAPLALVQIERFTEVAFDISNQLVWLSHDLIDTGAGRQLPLRKFGHCRVTAAVTEL